ncbi:MAG: bifunctional aldolase/short-chain dehydrogenase [Actinobacteria bacterium]|nr:bifunctional aldolase/short-chain dehydrogenase [Actinomycetota bacterium]
MASHKTIEELLGRSNRLGSNPKYTNYAGGNTSAKGATKDPSTGLDVEVMYVKGSGGDLGTLKEGGLAALYLDRLKALANVYRGLEHEDEMVALFDYCTFGKSGAAPSIDTAMHGLVDVAHVDHLHPDSIIALATAADGRALTKKCFGDEILWIDWRRPGFQLGLDIAELAKKNPSAKGAILGGHGLTTWASTSEECEKRSIDAINKAEKFLADNGRKDPFGDVVKQWAPLAPDARRARAAALAPSLRGIASRDARMIGNFSDADVVLDFISRKELTRLGALGTSCPDHFLRTKVSPMILDTPADAPLETVIARAHELHEEYRKGYADYYNRYATKESPAMRGADPLIILVPGVGMFSFGKDKQTARVAGEFYINAINVMRGAESVSSYKPIAESEKFNIEYWELEEAKLRRMPKPKALAGRIALVTGAGSGIGKATAERLASEGACVVIADRDFEAAKKVAAELGGADKAFAVSVDVTDEAAVAASIDACALAFGGVDLVVNNAGLSISKPLVETSVTDWDVQHNVMARGSFLVSREAAKAMIAQKMGGDIVYISSKNSVFAGPNNVAYGATKADQAHQVRLLAAELGGYGIRVNGVNPDGVVKGSGIFASGWGAQRAAVYGVEEEKLGEYYAQRTILKKEVLPDHIAAAVFVLCANELPLTTGLHIPVDGGVAAAFLR